MIDYDKQTELLDKEKEKLEVSEKLAGDLTKRLHVAVEQVILYCGFSFLLLIIHKDSFKVQWLMESV